MFDFGAVHCQHLSNILQVRWLSQQPYHEGSYSVSVLRGENVMWTFVWAKSKKTKSK